MATFDQDVRAAAQDIRGERNKSNKPAGGRAGARGAAVKSATGREARKDGHGLDEIRGQLAKSLQDMADKVDKKYKDELSKIIKSKEEEIHEVSTERYKETNGFADAAHKTMMQARDNHRAALDEVRSMRDQFLHSADDTQDLKVTLTNIMAGAEERMSQVKKKLKLV